MSELTAIDHASYVALARQSHAVIVKFQHANGAYPASPTFSAYEGYSWLRDGGFIAEGVSRFGDVASANAFHDWVHGQLASRREQVDGLVAAATRGDELDPLEMLPTRFAIEPGAAPDEWWNFQTDGYGTWLWSVVVHARRHGLALERWRSGIAVAVDYAAAFWDRPCYDWWEENLTEQHGSTLASLFGGLEAVATEPTLPEPMRDKARLAAHAIRKLVLAEGLSSDGRYLTKWLGSPETDGSLASAVVPFGLLNPSSDEARATLRKIREDLDAEAGVHRYRADEFFGGGQWPLLSCLLGWNQVVAGNLAEAWRYLDWVAGQFTSEGDLPEQLPHDLLNPEHRERWIEAWGPVATPLLWSHGMYLILADELGLLP